MRASEVGDTQNPRPPGEIARLPLSAGSGIGNIHRTTWRCTQDKLGSWPTVPGPLLTAGALHTVNTCPASAWLPSGEWPFCHLLRGTGQSAGPSRPSSHGDAGFGGIPLVQVVGLSHEGS